MYVWVWDSVLTFPPLSAIRRIVLFAGQCSHKPCLVLCRMISDQQSAIMHPRESNSAGQVRYEHLDLWPEAAG